MTGSGISNQIGYGNALAKASVSIEDFGNGSRALIVLQCAIDCDCVLKPILTAQYLRFPTLIFFAFVSAQLDTCPRTPRDKSYC